MIIVVIFLVLFIGGIIAISIVMSKLQSRASAEIFKDTPLGNESMNNLGNSILGKRATNKFLEQYGNIYTEESVAKYFMEVTEHILNKQAMDNFDSKLIEKMNSDKKLEKLVPTNPQVRASHIMNYARSILTVIVTLNNGRDLYSVMINANVGDNGIETITRYQIQKGAATGF